MKVSTVILLIIGLCSLMTLNAQTFVKKEIRDLQKMKNNYGNAVADYDLDGLLDVFIVAFDSYDPKVPETWSRLLKNYGGGRFEDATEEAGFKIQYTSSVTQDHKIGASWGDYDNDGYPDLFLTHMARTQLYLNLGNGRFKDVSTASKIDRCVECINNSALWWDYDNDGYLDLYISDARNPNRLYRNLGDGTFENVSEASGLGDPGSTWSSLPIDVNEDGWMDLLVLNDYGQSNFYENLQGHAFEDKTVEYGFENPGEAMGATVGDCNNDGHFDIYITNVSEFVPNHLYIGMGSGEFLNQATEQGVEIGHWAWGTHFFDADHDGDEDLYLVNGWPGFDHDNRFFKNLHFEGGEGFVDWSEQSSTNGSAHGMSTEVFDYDNDGDLDILVSNTNDAPDFYENIGAGGRNWLQVELQGVESNRNAFGAIVSVWEGDKFFQRFHHGSGIMTQSVKPVHFGLGSSFVVDSIVVDWPSGNRDIFRQIMPDQKIKIIENTSLVSGTTIITKASDEQVDYLPLQVYPNPFKKSIMIELKNQTHGRLVWKVYNGIGKFLHGHEITIGSQSQLEIDFADQVLPSGIYYLTFDLGGKSYSTKLIKQ